MVRAQQCASSDTSSRREPQKPWRRTHESSAGFVAGNAVEPGRVTAHETTLNIPVYSSGRERRQAYGNVLRAFRFRRTIALPLAAVCDDGLARGNVERSRGVLYAKLAAEHNRELVE